MARTVKPVAASRKATSSSTRSVTSTTEKPTTTAQTLGSIFHLIRKHDRRRVVSHSSVAQHLKKHALARNSRAPSKGSIAQAKNYLIAHGLVKKDGVHMLHLLPATYNNLRDAREDQGNDSSDDERAASTYLSLLKSPSRGNSKRAAVPRADESSDEESLPVQPKPKKARSAPKKIKDDSAALRLQLAELKKETVELKKQAAEKKKTIDTLKCAQEKTDQRLRAIRDERDCAEDDVDLLQWEMDEFRQRDRRLKRRLSRYETVSDASDHESDQLGGMERSGQGLGGMQLEDFDDSGFFDGLDNLSASKGKDKQCAGSAHSPLSPSHHQPNRDLPTPSSSRAPSPRSSFTGPDAPTQSTPETRLIRPLRQHRSLPTPELSSSPLKSLRVGMGPGAEIDDEDQDNEELWTTPARERQLQVQLDQSHRSRELLLQETDLMAKRYQASLGSLASLSSTTLSLCHLVNARGAALVACQTPSQKSKLVDMSVQSPCTASTDIGVQSLPAFSHMAVQLSRVMVDSSVTTASTLKVRDMGVGESAPFKNVGVGHRVENSHAGVGCRPSIKHAAISCGAKMTDSSVNTDTYDPAAVVRAELDLVVQRYHDLSSEINTLIDAQHGKDLHNKLILELSSGHLDMLRDQLENLQASMRVKTVTLEAQTLELNLIRTAIRESFEILHLDEPQGRSSSEAVQGLREGMLNKLQAKDSEIAGLSTETGELSQSLDEVYAWAATIPRSRSIRLSSSFQSS